jgi:hypothetical protein
MPGAVSASVDFLTAFAAREGLQFVFEAVKRMGRAPGKTHDLSAGFASWWKIDAKMSRLDLGCEFIHVTFASAHCRALRGGLIAPVPAITWKGVPRFRAFARTTVVERLNALAAFASVEPAAISAAKCSV